MTKATFQELAQKAHNSGVKHGFWRKDHSEEYCLMLVVSELCEAIEADRKGRRANTKKFVQLIVDDVPEAVAFEACIKDTVEDELADAVIRLGDLTAAKDLALPYWDIVRQRAWTREGLKESKEGLCGDCWNIVRLLGSDDSIKHKIVEAVFRIENIARSMKIDLLWHIDKKMKYNEGRPLLHGKRY